MLKEKNRRLPGFRPSARAAGFTMIELLVVLMILLVMAGAAAASFSGIGSPKQQLRREAREVTGLFRAARQAAMERKLKVEVYVDPAARAVCAAESAYARTLSAAEALFFSDGAALSEFEPDSNRFFRVVFFSEAVALEPFSLEEIEPETDEASPLFGQTDPGEKPEEPGGVSRPVFSFTSLGGATGGGIRVIRDGRSLDIACDLLTGQPEIVRRKERL